MRFFDEVKISIESGRGGNGMACGRKESGIPFGGPAGGDGGKGGNIVLQASKDKNTLVDFRYKKIFKADYGEPGRGKDQYGANAHDLLLTVPVGTLVKDSYTNKVLHMFEKDGEKRTALEGGEGGKGNIHFKSPILQYPDFALFGEPGHKKELTLELQLLGDVALIGTPSVGKSTIINAISNTKAKTADYEFTTLVPNLGSVKVKDLSFNVIDIPGLIKGAAEGKGLGNAFLRHILKARIFCFVVDLYRYNTGMKEIPALFEEIFTYIIDKFSERGIHIEQKNIHIKVHDSMIELHVQPRDEILMKKRILFVFNKYDLINDQEVAEEYKQEFFELLQEFFKKHTGSMIEVPVLQENAFVASGATHYGLDAWLEKIHEILSETMLHGNSTIVQEMTAAEMKGFSISSVSEHEEISDIIKDITETEIEILQKQGYLAEHMDVERVKVRKIIQPEICKWVYITQRGNDQAEMHFWKEMEEKGYIHMFHDAGILKGDVLKIVSFYETEKDKYIQY